jgi:hypothetical protein
MNPDQNAGGSPQQPAPSPAPHPAQPVPQQQQAAQYPPNIALGRQWQQDAVQHAINPAAVPVDTTPQLPQPYLPSERVEQPPVATPLPPASNSIPNTPYASQQTIPSYTTPDYSQLQPAPSRKKSVFIAIAVAIILLAVSAAAYVLVAGNDRGTDKQSGGAKQAVITASVASLDAVVLVPPADLSRYKPNSDNSAMQMAYNTDGNACSLQLGIADQQTVPGKDVADIVKRQAQALKDQGVTITGPSKADTLTLKDAADGNKRYTLPTQTFTATDSTKQVRTYYSAAVLKNGQRVYVSRSCQVNQGSVTDEALQPLAKDAATVTVIAQ